ncbi:uncharacterized protein Z520_04618 [Fonsecaea multimorphosa CBS 102226]|uniref:Uncharacterized protein n=1 Tax=Fonsecaea multimorphosa CBS 102226 TaxID=1442371 RepID=A0A0D2HDM1_9EURO|nr:uncharacterized protein Z520_04618 [Fonsecaea multimorphosa CBS 102226]KIX99980.1 hypothetical protein Z520_04618 [Fonsecaea multimorphosa CBS 102226]OAL26194.1 hypothetical protein AYO22_04372 [Fonsecaea multimorphosa]
MSPSNSKKNPPGHGRRRIKCTHPKCGSYGHFTSQCWVANPKLRPWGKPSRGTDGAWDLPADESNQVPNENLNPMHNWEAVSNTLPGQTSSPPYIPFPLFQLPQEIQDKIYEHVYDEKHGVRVFMSEIVGTRWGLEYLAKGGSEVVVRGYDYESVAYVSKKVREDSHRTRQKSFNGRMTIFWDKEYEADAFKKVCGPKFAAIRNRIMALSLCGLSHRSVGHGFDAVWRMLPAFFPRVNNIMIYYDAYRYIVPDPSPRIRDDGWLGNKELFDAGEMDSEFTWTGRILEMDSLVRYMADAAHPCKIHLNTAIHWFNDTFNRIIVLSQYVKFRPTMDGLDVVERVWDGA